MNKFKRFVSLVLVLCMVMAFVPAGISAAGASYAYNIVHVDAGRKYFSVDNLKAIIDNAADAGFNQVELYLSDNQGFRFALDDMTLTTEYGTYNLTPALGDGYSDGSKYPDGTNKYLTQGEMDEIIAYANGKGIEIVPCINVPGHMGAILEEFASFKYSGSSSSIDLNNDEAVAFALALTEKYAEYFADQGCKFYNVGADEYANDLSTMGFEGMGTTLYTKFVQFLNDAAEIVTGLGMTPRAFNDGFYYKDYSISIEPDKAYEVCYWTSGWSGYDVAAASTIAAKGHKMINANGDYYWVLGNSGWQCSSTKAGQFDETAFSGGTVSDPAGSMFCIWCDNAAADSAENVVANTAATIAAFGAAVPAVTEDNGSDVIPEPTAEVTDNKTITVNVGSTATDTITGTYTADESDLDTSIATVTVKNIPAQEATVEYTAASGLTCSDLISSNATKQATGYYYLVNGSYYPVYATRSGNYNYTYTWHYSADNGATYTQIGSTQSGSNWSDPTLSFTAYTKSGTEATEASTTVTFRGVALGTTYVQVGGVYYTINVVDQAPDNALTSSSVTLEYWITNLHVTCDGETSTTITTATAGVNTEEGVDLTTIAGATGTWDYGNVVYWKSVRLDEANEQTTGAGDDETADGTVMTHVRYHNNAWQYKTADGAWNYFLSTDQLVAYYLMPTTVTDQITTLTKDWGYDPSSNGDTPNAGQVALSFAVVDGSTLTPSEENIFGTSTTIFNFWDGRDIGVVAPVNNSNYEIYKITVTEGTRSSGTSNNWSTGDPTWEKTTNDLGTGEWFDEREVWNISEGTDPMVNGKLDNIVWTAKNTAFLILFYVRATNANLNVQYVDDSLGGALITERGVFADQDESFYDLEQTSAVPTTDGSFTLDDNATLTYYNYETEKNVVQTFEKSLLNFQDIQPQYRSGAYEYVGAEIADDGKTLILHYNINETVLKPRFVVDFGLSVSVPLTDIVANYGTSDVTAVQMMNAAYGTAVIEDGILTYTPSAVLQSAAAVTLKVTNSNDTITVFNVGFIPASTMAYEEGFATFTGSWTGGSTGSGEQSLQDSKDATGNYGYDAKYAAETGMTGGTQAVSTASGDKAELTFTGTGIDVYANCDTDTSTVAVLLYSGTSLVKMYQVDTSAVCGTSAATAGQDTLSYNLPIVSIQGLTHGTYRLEILHTKPADDTAEFRLDGFRVYNTLTASAAANDYPDEEMSAAFIELRNSVLAGVNITESSASDPYNWSGSILEQVYNQEGTLTGALVLSGNAVVDAQDLLENGPKNELFLHPGESVSFELNSGVTAQIGLKAVNGSASYTVNGTAGTITTSADMFYHEGLTGKVTIANTGSNLLSVTKLKVFGAAAAAQALAPVSESLVTHALTTMGILDIPFEDLNQAAYYFDAVLWAVHYGITNGVTPDQFMPNSDCSRAEIVTFLWRAAGAPEVEGVENPFVDVNEEGYYYDALLWAIDNGITTGIDATHFAPDSSCTRAQVVTFLWRANGCPESAGENPFTDVHADKWYTDAIEWAYENNITNGLTPDVYGVDGVCSRAQIVTFLYRTHKIVG